MHNNTQCFSQLFYARHWFAAAHARLLTYAGPMTLVAVVAVLASGPQYRVLQWVVMGLLPRWLPWWPAVTCGTSGTNNQQQISLNRSAVNIYQHGQCRLVHAGAPLPTGTARVYAVAAVAAVCMVTTVFWLYCVANVGYVGTVAGRGGIVQRPALPACCRL